MNKFSSYLKKKKPILKELVEKLDQDYKFASVLATDVKGYQYMVNRMTQSISQSRLTECGFVVRVYKDGNYFEYSFNDINDKLLPNIINDIHEMVNANLHVVRVNANMIKEETLTKKFKRNLKGTILNHEEIINLLKAKVQKGLALDSSIVNVMCGMEVAEYSKMYLSKNRDLEQYYPWINDFVNVMVRRDEAMKYAYDSFGTNNMDEASRWFDENLEEIFKLATELLDAEIPTPGIYTIITDPSITGLIAHEAFGHGLEMDQFVKDRAKGAEYINDIVGSKILSMHDGAKATESVASYFFDDEGVLAQDTKIINKGVLIGGICDSVSASILGYHPTGNGRRENYKHKVYTRMTNTFFEKGKYTLEEMIASVEYGYYICTTNNGMEDPKNWGIQCTALYGREIVNGKFSGKMISPVVMSGYVIDLLKSISMISKDNFTIHGSGSCGKGYKEWVRVSDGGSSIKAEVKIG